MKNLIINLQAKMPDAENFKYYELIRSVTAKRLNIDNLPDKKQLRNLENLARFNLQPIRNEFGGILITSGFRTPELNIKIGGSEYSNHCRGEAADIEPLDDQVQMIRIIEWVYVNLDFRELIAEFFPYGWIHIAYRKYGNIKKLKLKDENHDYEEISMCDLMSLYPEV